MCLIMSLCVCLSSAVGMWVVGCGHLAVCFAGQLCHFLPLLPLPLSRQSGHYFGLRRHGNGLSGMPRCHQGEQVPVAECKSMPTSPIMLNELVISVILGYKQSQTDSAICYCCTEVCKKSYVE